jgi:hypothetical protein
MPLHSVARHKQLWLHQTHRLLRTSHIGDGTSVTIGVIGMGIGEGTTAGIRAIMVVRAGGGQVSTLALAGTDIIIIIAAGVKSRRGGNSASFSVQQYSR